MYRKSLPFLFHFFFQKKMAHSSYSQSNKRPAETEAERKDDSDVHTFNAFADINPREDFQRLRDYCSLNSIWFEEGTDVVQWKSPLFGWCGNELQLQYGADLHRTAHIPQTRHMSIREYYIPLLIMVLHWRKLPNWTSLTPEYLFDDSANGEPRLPVAWSLYVADTSVSAQHTTQFNYYRSGYDRYVQITIKNLSRSCIFEIERRIVQPNGRFVDRIPAETRSPFQRGLDFVRQDTGTNSRWWKLFRRTKKAIVRIMAKDNRPRMQNATPTKNLMGATENFHSFSFPNRGQPQL